MPSTTTPELDGGAKGIASAQARIRQLAESQIETIFGNLPSLLGILTVR